MEMKERLCEILEKTECMASKIKEYDASKMTSRDFVEVFDLMKDTAMTMSYLAKAKYYDTVVDAMEHGNYVMTKEMYDADPESWKKYYTDDKSLLEMAMEKYDTMHDMESLDAMMEHISKELKDRAVMMDATQKNVVKTKLTNLVNTMR